jgi:hypothetical protein
MRLPVHIIGFVVFFMCLATGIQAQTEGVGAIGSIGLSKNLGKKWSAGVEQEFRFDQHHTGMERSLTALQLDYKLVPKVLKAGIEYNFVLQNNDNEYYENKHRLSFALSGETSWKRFEFSLRTRMQATWRDETRGDYRINPKTIWRNKLECAYDIFGKPVKPSVSFELFTPLNDVQGFYANGYRIRAGVDYRYSRSQSVDFSLRYDKDIQTDEPQKLLYLCVGWTYRL